METSKTQQYCTFYLQNDLYGVEVKKVQEVVRHQEVSITRVPLAPAVVGGLINLRGQIVTTIDLRKRLGLPDREPGQIPMHVVVNTKEGAVSLLVDEIHDVLEMTDETFERSPATLQKKDRDMICGAYKLKDRLLIVLDTDKVLQLEKMN
ncbi:MAG: chemotaxis protein CheW [Elusimicrobiota bacterium]|jgi:purine-binding chemotaxis protein CheW